MILVSNNINICKFLRFVLYYMQIIAMGKMQFGFSPYLQAAHYVTGGFYRDSRQEADD